MTPPRAIDIHADHSVMSSADDVTLTLSIATLSLPEEKWGGAPELPATVDQLVLVSRKVAIRAARRLLVAALTGRSRQ